MRCQETTQANLSFHLFLIWTLSIHSMFFSHLSFRPLESVKLSFILLKLAGMNSIGRRGIHCLHKLNAANVPSELIENGQNRVIEASLTLIRERAKLKVLLVSFESITISVCLLSVMSASALKMVCIV